jgi:hypothetical protein
MAKVGYTLMTEEAGPKDLVRWAARAEEAGFSLLVSSDRRCGITRPLWPSRRRPCPC